MQNNFIVWIDQHEAKIFRLTGDTVDESILESHHHHVRRHPVVTAERSHPADAEHYYRDVAAALHDALAVLVVGPGVAKLELIKHVHAHERALEPKIVGVETADHPTDRQIVAHARKYFASHPG